MHYCDLLTNVLEAHGGLDNWRTQQVWDARRDREGRGVSRIRRSRYITGTELFVDSGFAQV